MACPYEEYQHGGGVSEAADAIRVLRIDLVSHFDEVMDRHSIYSGDFQPGGARLVTGGAGECFVIDLYVDIASYYWCRPILQDMEHDGLVGRE
jgi:hypothetical protein